MILTRTTSLTEMQKKQITILVKRCRIYDGIRLSYPLEEEDCIHFLFFEGDYDEDAPADRVYPLMAALCLTILDDTQAECAAFTAPGLRRRGLFSRLLGHALEVCGERDLLFAVDERCAAALETLGSLGAELSSRELLMELDLIKESPKNSQALCHPCAALSAGDTWLLTDRSLPGSTPGAASDTPAPIGRCLVTPVSDGCVCLSHLEIDAAYRRRGYGSDLIALLLPRLVDQGIQTVILHVTEANAPAVTLYKKAGFRVRETLSYYLY